MSRFEMKAKTDIKTTKYPIVLVHGMGIRDRKRFNSWGRVPSTLRKNGFTVFHGMQDANGSVEDNAAVLKKTILQIIEETGCERVNIIAHSKGGLDARYMITHLDMADQVASLTTAQTPHHGSKTVDRLLHIPEPLVRFGCAITDTVMKVLGDDKPKTYEVIQYFKTSVMAEFNANTPDSSHVYYQSYAFIMKHWNSDLFMWLPHLVVKHMEGDNDGLLTPDSVKWGEFRGVYTGNSRRGISHCDEVDMRRCRFTSKKGDQISDIPKFYLDVAAGLAEKGF